MVWCLWCLAWCLPRAHGALVVPWCLASAWQAHEASQQGTCNVLGWPLTCTWLHDSNASAIPVSEQTGCSHLRSAVCSWAA